MAFRTLGYCRIANQSGATLTSNVRQLGLLNESSCSLSVGARLKARIMILKILLVMCAAIMGILLLAATKPDTYRIQRSITINAPPERVFALIDDFHQWPRWAPQDREDATMRRSYGLQSSGIGAVSQWTSDGSAGAGEMAITAVIPNSRIDVAVDWIKPFKVRNTHGFVITPEGQHIRVTWNAKGSNLFIMKIMEVFVGVNGLMGKHFDTGLKNLKAAAEK